jgi:hypothetical protein
MKHTSSMTANEDSNNFQPIKSTSILLRLLLLAVGIAAAIGAVWWFTTGQLIHEAKAAAAQNFRDPESVQFRRVRVVDGVVGQEVCGEVNEKNGFGAYVGFVQFMYTPPKKWKSGKTTAADVGIGPEQGDTSRPLWGPRTRSCEPWPTD